MNKLDPQPGDPWWLIFEREPVEGVTFVAGLYGGSVGHPGAKHTFPVKLLLLTRAPDWKTALENAIAESGRAGQFAAIECAVFLPDLLDTDGTEGTDK